jgi:Ca2+-binding RTX toxin-like protein
MNKLLHGGTALGVAAFYIGLLAPATEAATCTVRTTTETVDANHLGGAGNDLIQGEDDGGHDVISGQGGNDTLNGRGGNDLICGNTGNDAVVETNSPSGSQDSGDKINMGSGCDEVLAFSGPDIIIGGDDGDTNSGCTGGLYGEAGDDEIEGNKGGDYIDGGNGTSDWADGGTGTDTCTIQTETRISCEITA